MIQSLFSDSDAWAVDRHGCKLFLERLTSSRLLPRELHKHRPEESSGLLLVGNFGYWVDDDVVMVDDPAGRRQIGRRRGERVPEKAGTKRPREERLTLGSP